MKTEDGRLDADERKAALEHLKSQSEQGSRGRGRGRGRRNRGDVAGKPGSKVTLDSVEPIAGEDLYDTSVLRTIFLTFDNKDWEEELASFKPTDVEVPATMVVDGKTYPEVGVSFRGSSSFFMIPSGSKRSFNISMDFAAKKQRLYGLKTLNLLNCNGDPSLMSSLLYHDIASKKIATPRANFVKVVVNGRSWGVYANVEQFNKDFLKHNYESKKGARWKVSGNPRADAGLRYFEDDMDAYSSRYDMKSKEDPQAWENLVELTRIINQTPVAELDTALEKVLDVDGTLWFLAVDVALVNSDGYWTRASDYSIYLNEEGKFHILPHDMNEAFGLARGGGPGGRGGPGGPPGFGPPGGPGGGPPPGFGPPGGGFDSEPQERGARGDRRGGQRGDRGRGGRRGFAGPGGGGGHGGPDLDPLVNVDSDRFPLRSKLLANENLKRRYLMHLRTIATEYLDWNYLGPKVADAKNLIGKEVKADKRKLMTNNDFAKATAEDGSIYEFCKARAEYLLNHPQIKRLGSKE